MSFEDQGQSLFLRDEPEKAELIWVFGCSDPHLSAFRARHAAALYLEGFAPSILLSGGRLTAPRSEAQVMATACIEAGVPYQRLLFEQLSRNTYENATRAAELLIELGCLSGLRTVLLVSCAWHMHRANLMARRAFPAHVRFLCCPHEQCCTQANWRETVACKQRVLTELELVRRFRETGLLLAENKEIQADRPTNAPRDPGTCVQEMEPKKLS